MIMGKINSKTKGKVGENECVHILKKHGYENARRSVQYSGVTGDAPDIVNAIPGFHLEIKRCETTKIWDWLAQAERDHKEGTIPAVVFRRSRAKWQICMDFEQFLELLNSRS